MSIVGVPSFASQSDLHRKEDRFTKPGVVGWRTLSLLPRIWGDPVCGLVVHAYPDPGTILTGDCITLPHRGAASSEGLAAGGSGESPPQPGEPGEVGFYPLLSERLLLLGTWQLSSPAA